MPGDLVWLCGELFSANEIFCYKSGYRVVIRFTGTCLTSDGLCGMYGANATERATIVNRSRARLINSLNCI